MPAPRELARLWWKEEIGTYTSSGRRVFLAALVVSLCVTGAIAIGVLLFAEFDATAARILWTTALLSLASLLALPAGVLLDQDRARPLAWAVIAASAVGFAVAMVALWGAPDTEWIVKLAVTVGLAAGAGAQAAATTSRLREGERRRLRTLYWIAIVLAVALAVLVAVAIWAEIQDAPGYYRVLGATGVAAVLASLLQPIIRRMEAPAEQRHELVLTLDSPPSDEAVAAAVEALEEQGVRVEEVASRGSRAERATRPAGP